MRSTVQYCRSIHSKSKSGNGPQWKVVTGSEAQPIGTSAHWTLVCVGERSLWCGCSSLMVADYSQVEVSKVLVLRHAGILVCANAELA